MLGAALHHDAAHSPELICSVDCDIMHASLRGVTSRDIKRASRFRDWSSIPYFVMVDAASRAHPSSIIYDLCIISYRGENIYRTAFKGLYNIL